MFHNDFKTVSAVKINGRPIGGINMQRSRRTPAENIVQQFGTDTAGAKFFINKQGSDKIFRQQTDKAFNPVLVNKDISFRLPGQHIFHQTGIFVPIAGSNKRMRLFGAAEPQFQNSRDIRGNQATYHKNPFPIKL